LPAKFLKPGAKKILVKQRSFGRWRVGMVMRATGNDEDMGASREVVWFIDEESCWTFLKGMENSTKKVAR